MGNQYESIYDNREKLVANIVQKLAGNSFWRLGNVPISNVQSLGKMS